MEDLFSQFAGSVYEKVNICGDTLEFDIMFVKIREDLKVVNNNVRSGYVHLEFVLSPGVLLDTEKYKRNFCSSAHQWLHTIKGICITLRNHGLASQLDVFVDEEAKIRKTVWFCIDLVPALEISKISLFSFP